MLDQPYQRFRIVHEVIRWQGACNRRSTQSIKNRSQVSGAHRKLWRQKESGRARQGDGKACHFRGGGACFSIKNRDHSFKINKKCSRLASRVVLAHKFANNGIIVYTEFEKASLAKTKDAHNFLRTLAPAGKILFVSDQPFTGVQNLRDVKSIKPLGVNVKDMCNRVLVFDKKSILATQERFI